MNNNQKTESEKLPVFKSIEELVGQCKIHPDMPFEERSDFNISPNKSYRCTGCGRDEFEFTVSIALRNLKRVNSSGKPYVSMETGEMILSRMAEKSDNYKEILSKCKKIPMSSERQAKLEDNLEHQTVAYGCPKCGIVVGDYKKGHFLGVSAHPSEPYAYIRHTGIYCANCDKHLGETREEVSISPILLEGMI